MAELASAKAEIENSLAQMGKSSLKETMVDLKKG